MVKVPTQPYDTGAAITTPEDAAFFLADALESGDPAVVASALGTIARARGASELARKTGLSRAVLYKALREGGNPTLSTLLTLLDEFGVELTARPKAA